MYYIQCHRQLVLWIFGTELCHRLDIQYCPDLHCAQAADEQPQEVDCWCCSRMLCYVSHDVAHFPRFILTLLQRVNCHNRSYSIHQRPQRHPRLSLLHHRRRHLVSMRDRHRSRNVSSRHVEAAFATGIWRDVDTRQRESEAISMGVNAPFAIRILRAWQLWRAQ